MTTGAALLVSFALMQSPVSLRAGPSLTLTCGETASELALAIHNADRTDTAVLLGIALANGQWYLPKALVVETSRSGSPVVEELVYSGPAGIAGRIDHWVVALPAGATFTLTLHGADFISTTSPRVVSTPEELRVRLTGRAITSDLNVDMTGMKTWRVWTGDVRSNAVRLSDCRS